MASAQQNPISSPSIPSLSHSRAQLEILQAQSGALRDARSSGNASITVRSLPQSTAREAEGGGEVTCNANGNTTVHGVHLPSLYAPGRNLDKIISFGEHTGGDYWTNKTEIKDKKHGILNWFKSTDNAKGIDPIDHLKEQLKDLAGEASKPSDIAKGISDDTFCSANKNQIEGNDEKNISAEKQSHPSPVRSLDKKETPDLSLIKCADKRVQDQLHHKALKCQELKERVATMRQKHEKFSGTVESGMSSQQPFNGGSALQVEFFRNEEGIQDMNIKAELLCQEKALDLDEMKQKLIILTTERNQLEVQNKALLEETSYAKELASASGMELKTLSRQVGKLMKQNERLATELATLRNANRHKVSNAGKKSVKQDGITKRYNKKMILQEMDASYEHELSLESSLRETRQKEAELQKIVDELKKKEAYLENELASMWVLVGNLRSAHGIQDDDMELRICESNVAQLLSTPFS